MKKLISNDDTDERTVALQFYKVIVQALRSNGIKKILVSMSREGELEADVVIEKNPSVKRGDKEKPKNARK
jgi:hypothetical protein